MNLKFRATKHRVMIICCLLLSSVIVFFNLLWRCIVYNENVILYSHFMLDCCSKIHFTIKKTTIITTCNVNSTFTTICRLLGFHTCGRGQRKIVWTLSPLQAHLNINALVTSMLIETYHTLILSFILIYLYSTRW